MLILDKYTPEEYASFWGCEPRYDKTPRIFGDGPLFYNFSIENSKVFFKKFIPAIDRTIEEVKLIEITKNYSREEQLEDIQGLTELKEYVNSLLTECVPA